MNWEQYNCVIVTRHGGNKILYNCCMLFLKDIPYKKIPLINTSAAGYLEQIIRLNYDWVINIDDDAFLVNKENVYNLLTYMNENNYDYCGMADGGFDGCRYGGNPCSMNPFFNILHLSSIKQKINIKNEFIGISFEDSLKKLVNHSGFKCPKDRCKYNPTLEPYYPFFFRLLRDTKPLFLKATLHNDKTTTILYNHANDILMYHTWYGRVYHINIEHNTRINEIIKDVHNMHKSGNINLKYPELK